MKNAPDQLERNQDGDGAAKELSPWSEFDLDEAAKKNKSVADLRDGKVAVLDGDKDDKGNPKKSTRLWDANAIQKVDAFTVRLNGKTAQLAIPLKW